MRNGSLPEGNGGVLGIALGNVVRNSFSNLGAVVVLGYALLVGLVLVALRVALNSMTKQLMRLTSLMRMWV